MTARRTSLWGLIFWRIAIFAALAMLIQFAVVTYEYWSDETKLVRKVITTETDLFANGLKLAAAGMTFELPSNLIDRYRPADDLEELEANGYFVLLNDQDGHTIFTNCDTPICQSVLNHDTSHMPDFWFHMLAAGKPLSFVGGRRLLISGEKYQFNIGVFNDPQGLIYGALLEEVESHMLIPMSIMLLLIVGATTLSIRSALRPVLRSSRLAAQADLTSALLQLDTSGMPKEIAQFSDVINRNFTRINELVKGQKLFASAISHEIRTPVSIVRLELEKIDHPRAKKAIEDLDSLTHLLNQLTLLAKMDTVEPERFIKIDLADLVEKVVSDMVPFVYSKSKTIELENRGGGQVIGLPYLLENLVRNLVENSIKHTPAGTHIVVKTGPGATLTVEDNGLGVAPRPSHAGMVAGHLKLGDGLGIGLNIIARIAAIHGAEFDLESKPGKGTCATTRFRA